MMQPRTRFQASAVANQVEGKFETLPVICKVHYQGSRCSFTDITTKGLDFICDALYRVFSLMWPSSALIYCNKRKSFT